MALSAGLNCMNWSPGANGAWAQGVRCDGGPQREQDKAAERTGRQKREHCIAAWSSQVRSSARHWRPDFLRMPTWCWRRDANQWNPGALHRPVLRSEVAHHPERARSPGDFFVRTEAKEK